MMTLYHLGEAHRKVAEMYRGEQELWRHRILTAASEANLIDKEALQTLRSVPLPASLRRHLPRWRPFEQNARAAVAAYDRVADLLKPTPALTRPAKFWLADDALRNAGTLQAGLGSTSAAMAFYEQGIGIGGDQRQLLALLRDSLRASTTSAARRAQERSLVPIIAMLFGYYQPHATAGGVGDDLANWEDEREDRAGGRANDLPLAAYVRLRADLARGDGGNAARLLETIVGGDWSHPITTYLLELWYAATATDPGARLAMARTINTKLAGGNLGPAQFYVRLVSARLAIDAGDYAAARVTLDLAERDSPFRRNAALVFEQRRLLAREGAVAKRGTDHGRAVPQFAVGTRFLYMGSELLPIDSAPREPAPSTRPGKHAFERSGANEPVGRAPTGSVRPTEPAAIAAGYRCTSAAARANVR